MSDNENPNVTPPTDEPEVVEAEKVVVKSETREPEVEKAPQLERLGGEPAPDISPEEFARLQQSGQIHIDPRGRVRSTSQEQNTDAGVSLRKRRAWYA